MKEVYITLGATEQAKVVVHAAQGESQATKLIMTVVDAQSRVVVLPAVNKMAAAATSSAEVIPEGAQANLYIDKKGVPVIVSCNVSGNTASAVLPYQACTLPGYYPCTLQILTAEMDSRELPFTLEVTPNSLDSYVSLPDFGPLTEIMRQSSYISYLLADTQKTVEQFADVLGNYIDELVPYMNGTIELGGAAELIPCFDADGKLYLFDGSTYGSVNSQISGDFGLSWSPLSLPESMQVEAAIVGGKVLIADESDFSWGGPTPEGIGLSFSEPAETGVTNRVSPPYQGHGGLYAIGKYFLILQSQGSFKEPPYGRNFYYMDESGSSFKQITMPDDRQAINAIAYDPIIGKFIIAGNYAPSTSPTEEDLLNYTTFIYLAAASDIFDSSKWVEVYNKYDTLSSYRGAAYFDKKFYLIPQGTRSGNLRLIQVDAETGGHFILDVPTPDGSTYYCDDICTNLSGLFILCNSGAQVAYSMDGKNFKFYDTGMTGTYPHIAGSGRHIAITADGDYAIYKTTFVGEDLVTNLQKLQDEYNRLIPELEAAAGRKIELTTTDPGIGSPLEEGKILFVYEE